MEILDIADEYGNLTGETADRNKVHDLCLWHWEIAVFVVNSNKQLLLQKRAATKRFNPNMWGLCAGHVDSGEGLEETALRELEEEIGIQFKLEDLNVLVEKDVRKDPDNYHFTKYYYVVCDRDDFKIQEEEVSEVKWFDIDEVIRMILNEDKTIVIKMDRLHLVEMLKEIYN